MRIRIVVIDKRALWGEVGYSFVALRSVLAECARVVGAYGRVTESVTVKDRLEM